jgi:hypothetical protein
LPRPKRNLRTPRRADRHAAGVATLVGLMRQYVHSPAETRRVFNEAGVHLSPADFYSPIPTVDEIERSFEYTGEPPYMDRALFDREHLASALASLQPYAWEFAPPADGDAHRPGSYFWNNPMFSSSDAMAYYCMIRRLKPRRIVEVGSGFSTLVALDALRKNGSGELVCVEPYPRDFLREAAEVTVVQKKAEEVPPAFFEQNLADGDILFIDSTHTVKSGGDCAYLYLKVLPNLTARLMVHVHDVFLPYGYPKQWLLERQWYWAEQYLVHAYLTDNARTKVCFGTVYHAHFAATQLAAFLGGKCPVSGASLWFQQNPRNGNASHLIGLAGAAGDGA